MKRDPQERETADHVSRISTPQRATFRDAVRLIVPHPLHSRVAWSWLRATLTDFALILLTWLLIGAILIPLRRAFPSIRVFGFSAGLPTSLLGVGLLHASLITLLGHSELLYVPGTELAGRIRVLGKSVLFASLVLGLAYCLQYGVPTGALIAVAGVMHFTALLMARWYGAKQEIGTESHGRRNVLIVGAGATGRRVAANIEKRGSGRELCGFLDDEHPIGHDVLGRTSELGRVARTCFIDEVIIAAPSHRDSALRVLREACRLRLDVEVVPDLLERDDCEPEIERLGDLPMICLHNEPSPTLALWFKRLLDLVGASTALVFLGPSMLLISVLIRLDSPGPALYNAKRVGRKGRLFRCYKFRTMVSNAQQLKDDLRSKNQRSGPFFKLTSDPRITRVGRILRRYSLDELPQLLNVLKGDMSLVGPRPHPLDDVAAYEIEHLSRLDVIPGMTGLWQVTARRDPSFDRGMKLDREYIQTWTLGNDLRILAQTVLEVVRGGGE